MDRGAIFRGRVRPWVQAQPIEALRAANPFEFLNVWGSNHGSNRSPIGIWLLSYSPITVTTKHQIQGMVVFLLSYNSSLFPMNQEERIES